ncbi:MAG: DUF6531 domain-containing protein, partial [Halioglobus sp.]|nr:DUF6531 domain-containing protein [Halioglobus sp.]
MMDDLLHRAMSICAILLLTSGPSLPAQGYEPFTDEKYLWSDCCAGGYSTYEPWRVDPLDACRLEAPDTAYVTPLPASNPVLYHCNRANGYVPRHVDRRSNPCWDTDKPWFNVSDSLDSACCSTVPGRCPSPDPCEDSTANPVALSTGTKRLHETDFRAAGNGTLVFARRWDSDNKQWLFSYRQRLVDYSTAFDAVVAIHEASGDVVSFLEVDGAWVPAADEHATLDFGANEWIYRTSSGHTTWFDGAGRLIRTRGASGGGVDVQYPGGAAMLVADEYGNRLDISLDAAGRVTAMVDPDGARYRYAYNADGHLQYVGYPDDTQDIAGSNPFGEDNPFREYHYEYIHDDHLVTGITDENGERHKTIAYNDRARVVSSGLAGGSIGGSTFDHTHVDDPADPRITVTNPLGRETVYHLQDFFGVRRVTRIDGLAQPATGCLADVRTRDYYPGNGWLRRKTDRAGNVTFYEYYLDAPRYGLLKRRVEAESSAQERIFEFDWYPASRLKKRETLVGVRQTDYTYWPDGREHTRTESDLTGLADEPARTWTTTYAYHDPGAAARVAAVTVDGPRAGSDDVHTSYYSAQGFLTRTADGYGQETRYEDHNGRGQPQRMVDANGVVTALTYTPRGWLDSVTRDVGGLDAVTHFAYDKVGQLTGVTSADGVQLSFEYDAAHRMSARQNALGERIEYSLDAAGKRTAVAYKRADGTTSRSLGQAFDGLGRIWKRFGANGQQTDYTWDDKGQLVSIDDGVNPATSRFFDAHNRLRRVVDATGGETLVDYDTQDNIDGVTDPRGVHTQTVYDGFGDLQLLVSPDTGTTQYDYDGAGNRIRSTDARGVTTHYTYDRLNRLTAVTYPDAGLDVAYVYGNGVVCPGYCRGRLVSITDVSGSTAYRYDALGRITARDITVNVPGASPLVLA